MVSGETVIDTFPSFLKAVETRRPEGTERWIELWTESYMSLWPELFEMLVADYADQGEDWQKIAREMVFPGMNEKLPAMRRACQDLRRIIGPIEDKARRSLDFSGRVNHVIYVGLGNGAGWVTTYAGRPAVLFGLEGIVDSGFDSPAKLDGLVAHELGHVVHFFWREQRGLNLGTGPWWQLYEEGFAQYCEHQVLGRESWHMRSAVLGEDWLDWCRQNRAWLAAEFVRIVDADESVRPFFGSWYDVRGRKQTGYYLGHEAIGYLAATMSMHEIALIEEGEALEKIVRRVLHALATHRALL